MYFSWINLTVKLHLNLLVFSQLLFYDQTVSIEITWRNTKTYDPLIFIFIKELFSSIILKNSLTFLEFAVFSKRVKKMSLIFEITLKTMT